MIWPLKFKDLFATNNIPNDYKIFYFEGGADKFAVNGPIDIGHNSLAQGFVLRLNSEGLFFVFMLFWLRLLGWKNLTINCTILANLIPCFGWFLLLLFLCWLILLLLIHEVILDVGISSFTVHSKLVNIDVWFEIAICINGEAANDFFREHVKKNDYTILATDSRHGSLRIKFNN